MKEIILTENHQLGGTLGNHPDALNLYKELLIKNKHLLTICIKTVGGVERKVKLTSLHPSVQSIIMEKIHTEAIAGRHI
jgi:hypothetical protein